MTKQDKKIFLEAVYCLKLGDSLPAIIKRQKGDNCNRLLNMLTYDAAGILFTSEVNELLEKSKYTLEDMINELY